jgi:glycosyltransferase involved in cell wall biosynthesis
MAVVVPARDEERLLGACLASVLRATADAGAPTLVVVVAHRCTDRTADVAASVLRAGRGAVLLDHSPTVATARAAGAAVALAWLASRTPAPDRGWLVSTDADTTVPRGWLGAIARHAAAGAAAVAGLVEVAHDRRTPPAARAAYRELVAAGLAPRGHHHVHGANLAIRADAYLAAGGWPAVAPGEDHALLAAVRAAGRPVVAARDVVVRTSGRHDARAADGLGALLGRLSHGVTPDPALPA